MGKPLTGEKAEEKAKTQTEHFHWEANGSVWVQSKRPERTLFENNNLSLYLDLYWTGKYTSSRLEK